MKRFYASSSSSPIIGREDGCWNINENSFLSYNSPGYSDDEYNKRAYSGEEIDMYEIEEGLDSLNLDPPPNKKIFSDREVIEQLNALHLNKSGDDNKVVYCGNGVFLADDDTNDDGDDDDGSIKSNDDSLSNLESNDVVLPPVEE